MSLVSAGNEHSDNNSCMKLSDEEDCGRISSVKSSNSNTNTAAVPVGFVSSIYVHHIQKVYAVCGE